MAFPVIAIIGAAAAAAGTAYTIYAGERNAAMQEKAIKDIRNAERKRSAALAVSDKRSFEKQMKELENFAMGSGSPPVVNQNEMLSMDNIVPLLLIGGIVLLVAR